MTTAAEMLEGLELANGWKVKNRITRHAQATGANFSVGYLVQNQANVEAFCKALDFSSAFQTPNPAQTLNSMTEAFLFEQSILEACRDARMRRVVQFLDTGNIKVENAPEPNTVQYLILEIASGDIRKTLAESDQVDWAWKMRCLHHTCTGMEQLHSNNIAHQDLKPSNILDCGKEGHKITDVGRASRLGIAGPSDKFSFAGDRGYAPPEARYENRSPVWNDRLATDCYMMGGMVFFIVTQSTLWASILSHLDEGFRPGRWTGQFAEVVPYFRDAFDLSVKDFEKCLPDLIRTDLSRVLRQLSEPDPVRRGHPDNFNGYQNKYSLEKYISLFDLLAKRCEVRLRQ